MQYLAWFNHTAIKDGSVTKIKVTFICSHDVAINPPIKANIQDTLWVTYSNKRPRNTSKGQCLALLRPYGITDLLPINQQGDRHEKQ